MTLQLNAQRGQAPAGTLSNQLDVCHNSINALRLALAGVVLISHCMQLSWGRPDPLGHLTSGALDMGTMSVDGFFALSGFLIATSFRSSPSTRRYFWRRALRIFPAFWVCLVVTAFVLAPLAWLLAHRTLAGFPLLGDRSAVSYIYQNSALLIRQFYIDGAFGAEPVNGSLHTLFYEFICYALVAVLGTFGLLSRRRSWVLGIATAAAVVALLEATVGIGLVTGHPGRELMFRFGTMFLWGVLATLFSDRVRISGRGAVVALAGVSAGVAGAAVAGEQAVGVHIYTLVAAPGVVYLVLLAGSTTALAKVGARRDLSYGLYVYAWPVQVILLLVGAGSWWLPAYIGVSLGVALGMAYLSWTFVEAPALELKRWTPPTLRRGGRHRRRVTAV